MSSQVHIVWIGGALYLVSEVNAFIASRAHLIISVNTELQLAYVVKSVDILGIKEGPVQTATVQTLLTKIGDRRA